MKLDIRTPLGLLFIVLGLLLAIFGAASPKDLYARSLDININLWWGLVLIVFGGSMLLLARWSHQRAERDGHGVATPSSGKGAAGHE